MEVSPAKSLILSATIHGGSYFFIQPVEKSVSSFIHDTSYTYCKCFKIILFDFKYLFDNYFDEKYTINT